MEAMRLLVLLGLLGASIARHYQEHHGTDEPERAFYVARLGPDYVPFLEYYAALAERSGTGHPDRDSYSALVRWNVPHTEVHYRGELLASIEGVFPDGRIRTYTGTRGEESFFEVIKMGECLEQAANRMLAPIADGRLPFAEPKAIERVATATAMLYALRHLMLEFPHLPASVGMHPAHFMDVFRQFAVHWRPGDLPPSGAMDTEAITRDFLLGISYPGYADGIRRLFPGLLSEERHVLARQMDQPSLPTVLLRGLNLTTGDIDSMSRSDKRGLVVEHPELVAWFNLLQAHGRASSAHLGLSKKMLFNPQRRREAADLAGDPVVDNHIGTTGMTETFLTELTRHRQQHQLRALRDAVVHAGLAVSDEIGLEVQVTVEGRVGLL